MSYYMKSLHLNLQNTHYLPAVRMTMAEWHQQGQIQDSL